MLYTHTHTHTQSTHEAAEPRPPAQQEQGTQLFIRLCATDRLIGLILRGKEYPELFRLNNSVEMLNPSQEFLCERREVQIMLP